MLADSVREANETAGRDAASVVRDKHRLDVAPIADVAALFEEEMGFDVLVTEMADGVDAMVAADEVRERFIIGVAMTSNAERQRFSIAHELGHAYFQDLLVGVFTHDAESEEEDRAHCFARHFLIPVDGMELRLRELGAAPSRVHESHLSALVQYFGVSAYVAARQMSLAGWIDDAQYQHWKTLEAQQLSALYGWESERQARVATSMTPRTPQRIIRRAAKAYSSGLISLQMLAAIRGDETLDATSSWLARAGISVEVADVPGVREFEGEEF